jgi:hypothetical protein
MPFAEEFMLQGTTTASQTATLPASIRIPTGFLPTKVMITNETQFGQTGTGNLNIQTMLWDSTNPTNTKVFYINAAGTAILPGVVSTNGISQYNGQITPDASSTNSIGFGALVTGGALSKANPAQLTSNTHGLQTGDQILITGPFTATTAMNQLGGMIFTVTVTGANTVTIPINTNTANFTATTVTSWRKVLTPPYYYPQRAFITGITAANPIVVTTSTNHGYTVGQQVRLRVPSQFGMIQANNLQGVITAVTSTTLTINSIDSSAFTAFAWPAVTSLPFTQPYVEPVGSSAVLTTFLPSVQYGYDTIDDAANNQSFQGFTIGTGLLQTSAAGTIGVTASDVLSWTAWRASI